jgi:hypothetical protein
MWFGIEFSMLYDDIVSSVSRPFGLRLGQWLARV